MRRIACPSSPLRCPNVSISKTREQALATLKAKPSKERYHILRKMSSTEKDALFVATPSYVPERGKPWEVDWGTFMPRSSSYSVAKAHALAVASKRVYEPLECIKQEYEEQGFRVKIYEQKGSQSLLAIHQDFAMLVFRGTETKEILQDLHIDLQLFQSPARLHDFGSVHTGFQKSLEHMWREIQEDIASLP
ncbi:MAG: hypothetical protein AAGJ35_06600, partial [Myxococcota bacterium]